MTKKKTMYMHTLEGRPASFAPQRELRDGERVTVPWIGFTRTIHLVRSLRTIRAQQQATIEAAAYHGPTFHWADPRLYDYVRVEVPNV
jgi:hypothetical protein